MLWGVWVIQTLSLVLKENRMQKQAQQTKLNFVHFPSILRRDKLKKHVAVSRKFGLPHQSSWVLFSTSRNPSLLSFSLWHGGAFEGIGQHPQDIIPRSWLSSTHAINLGRDWTHYSSSRAGLTTVEIHAPSRTTVQLRRMFIIHKACLRMYYSECNIHPRRVVKWYRRMCVHFSGTCILTQ